MRTKIILAITIIGIMVVILFNSELMPLRRDISNTEIIMVAGLDKVEEGYRITLLKRNQSSDSSSSSSKSSDSSESKVICMTADSYSMALRQLQTTTDKFLTASHIKYFIIGEETLKTDIEHVTDAIARGYQTRLNSKIYIAKEMSAKDFLEKASKLDFKVAEKIRNMEENFWISSASVETSIVDLGHITFSERGDGLVDTLEFYDSNREEEEKMEPSNDKNTNKEKTVNSFTYGGAAIIANNVLIEYLNTEQTIYANYILKEDNVNVIKIYDEEYFVSFRVEKLNTDISFNFDKNDVINEIIIDVDFQADYEETNAEVAIFTQKKIEYFENKLNNKVEEQLREIIALEMEKEVDFLNLSQKLEFSHPFKYENNKKDFMKLLKKSKITINGKGKIKTTYDIIDSNEHQKGEIL